MTRATTALAAGALGMLAISGATAADERSGLRALEEMIVVESRLLAQAEADRVALHEEQAAASATLSRLTRELANALRAAGQVDIAADDLERLQPVVVQAERDVHSSLEDVQRLHASALLATRRVSDIAERLTVLRERAIETRTSPQEIPPPLEGTWDVVVGPLGDHGWFRLHQDGTLVTGRYEMASTRNGSLTGTFVAGKLQLDQVDAKHGRDVTYYGLFAPASDTLKGSWESKLVGTGQAAFGNWSAKRRPETETAESP